MTKLKKQQPGKVPARLWITCEDAGGVRLHLKDMYRAWSVARELSGDLMERPRGKLLEQVDPPW